MTRITRSQFADYIATNDLKSLFIDMGWNNDNSRYAVIIDNTPYTLTAIAQKEGFKIVRCDVATIPDYQMRWSIDSQFSRQAHEHMIIFVDSHCNQRWLIPVRQADKPTRIVEIPHHHGQDIEALYQRARGLFFNLDEEGNITIVDVIERVTGQLSQNSEKVTKKFYERFRKEHQSFRTHIHNIPDDTQRDWYASLMLNRLMFCYFIQKKRFLDDNPNYLASKLQQSQAIRGSNQFYSFYRDFLLVLFHDGLGGKKSREQVQSELGRIPYLNGGLFDVHELEQRYPDITIGDAAFAQIFAFFDEYDWHLDSNPAASGREVNPDVIGYIFEKYINDRAQMGAYYTKEDITEYIGKNCIIPFLFDATARAGGADIWDDAWELLRTSGDTYIYPAVKHGCALELPSHIAVGISAIALRDEWNKPATAAYANPTEIWREVVARRQRYDELCHTITNGDIRHINDLITYNLNIRQFCQDVLATTSNSEVIRHFYAALTTLTVLDPTCGSGAFLFAALNILEPLYGECLNRMQVFVEERPTTRDTFGAILNDMRSTSHPNPQYFIYKSIILNNLYGVDIMKEATEVAKLRLFLKLVASVDADKRKPNLGIEPLPDIDFNIRAGNALVGFATKQALDDALITTINGNLMSDQMNALSAKVAQDFAEYKELQLNSGKYELLGRTKKNLQTSLRAINAQLNELLHQAQSGTPYDAWLTSHQPFHWFAEFYEIIVGHGGFDVIIGNPPYVEYSKVQSTYTISNYSTIGCGNLHAFFAELTQKLLNLCSRSGLIVPMSVISSERMKDVQKHVLNRYSNLWLSHYSERPAQLFSGARPMLTICISCNTPGSELKNNRIYSTTLHRWHASMRDILFSLTHYDHVENFSHKEYAIPKLGNKYDTALSKKLSHQKNQLTKLIIKQSSYKVHYNRSFLYWFKCFTFQPVFSVTGTDRTNSDDHQKTFFVENSDDQAIFACLLNSNLFYWYVIKYSNGREFTQKGIGEFLFDKRLMTNSAIILFRSLHARLMQSLQDNSKIKHTTYQSTGSVSYQEFFFGKSKPIIDEIDRVLAQHYGFSDEELDYIINYDIKYRMSGGDDE